LAAIQGLNAKVDAKEDGLQRKYESLEAENVMLAARLAEVAKQNTELADRLAEAFDREGGVLLRPFGREGVPTWSVEGKRKERDPDAQTVKFAHRPGHSLHEMVARRKAIHEDRHRLVLDPQVERSEESRLVVAVASVLVLDVFEDQRVKALPTPLGEADAMRSEPALLHVDSAGLGAEIDFSADGQWNGGAFGLSGVDAELLRPAGWEITALTLPDRTIRTFEVAFACILDD